MKMAINLGKSIPLIAKLTIKRERNERVEIPGPG
jgi:hypothetical protein